MERARRLCWPIGIAAKAAGKPAADSARPSAQKKPREGLND